MLDVKNLCVDISASDGRAMRVVDGISFALAAGETLGVVGESGSGKSMLALSIIGLLPAVAHASGEVLLKAQNLLNLDERDMCAVRGKRIGMSR